MASSGDHEQWAARGSATSPSPFDLLSDDLLCQVLAGGNTACVLHPRLWNVAQRWCNTMLKLGSTIKTALLRDKVQLDSLVTFLMERKNLKGASPIRQLFILCTGCVAEYAAKSLQKVLAEEHHVAHSLGVFDLTVQDQVSLPHIKELLSALSICKMLEKVTLKLGNVTGFSGSYTWEVGAYLSSSLQCTELTLEFRGAFAQGNNKDEVKPELIVMSTYLPRLRRLVLHASFSIVRIESDVLQDLTVEDGIWPYTVCEVRAPALQTFKDYRVHSENGILRIRGPCKVKMLDLYCGGSIELFGRTSVQCLRLSKAALGLKFHLGAGDYSVCKLEVAQMIVIAPAFIDDLGILQGTHVSSQTQLI